VTRPGDGACHRVGGGTVDARHSALYSEPPGSRAAPPLALDDGPTAMFRWPDRLLTVILAYGMVFVGLPVLCLLSYLWVKGIL
jgi:hypothetical protein